MEISRIALYATIMELTSMRLLSRLSAVDRSDGPSMFTSVGLWYNGCLGGDLDVRLGDLFGRSPLSAA